MVLHILSDNDLVTLLLFQLMKVEKANGLFYMHHTEYSQKMTTRRCISGIDIKIDEEVEFF